LEIEAQELVEQLLAPIQNRYQRNSLCKLEIG